MLVLTRNRNEGIVLEVLDIKVRIVVVEVQKGGRVRLGIDAPREVVVRRDELGKRKDAKE